MNQNQNQTNETDDCDDANDSQQEFYPCKDCGDRYRASELYCLKLSELSRIKHGWIKKEELPQYATCQNCMDSTLVFRRDYFTLESAMARCEADNSRLHGNNNGRRGQGSQRPSASQQQPAARVTVDEMAEIVLCVTCLAVDKVTRMERRDAMAPGWLGCQIMEGLRRYPKDLCQDDFIYLGSREMLHGGVYGFATCHECMDELLEVLREKAVALGYSEEVAAEQIQAWSLIQMIKGVRRAEQRAAAQNS